MANCFFSLHGSNHANYNNGSGESGGSPEGFWELEKKPIQQGGLVIILSEPGSKLLMLESWGALSKINMLWCLGSCAL